MDDLVVTPWSNISSISLLSKFNIKDASALEEKDVQIGMDEGLILLKHALGSDVLLSADIISNWGKYKVGAHATTRVIELCIGRGR
ncbi:DUF674 family protein [Tanacetum coccineum]